MNRVVYFFERRLEGADHRSLGDHLGCLRTDDVDSKDLSVLGICHDFDKTLSVSQRHRLPAGLEGEPTHLDLTTPLFGLLLGQADTGHLGRAIRAVGNLERIHPSGFDPSHILDCHDPLGHRLVGKEGAADHIADRIDAWNRGFESLVDLDKPVATQPDPQCLES